MNTPATIEPTPMEKTVAPTSRSIAVIISIDQYEDAAIANLSNAVNDGELVRRVLAEHHHYDIRVLGSNGISATKARMLGLFKDLCAEVGPDDRVLIYFAGHGVAEDSQTGLSGDMEGFLLPQDAKEREPESYLSMKELLDAIRPLPCRHLLLILDCCFAGTIRWQTTRSGVGLGVPKMFQERYERYLRDQAWQVITSAAYDERAIDRIGDRDLGGRGKADDPDHSPFAAALCRGLDGEADLKVDAGRGDGVIIAAELHLFLENAMKRLETQLGKAQQKPQLLSLSGHDKGQYVFLVPGQSPQLPSAVALTETNSPYLGLQAFDKRHARLFHGREALKKDLFAAVERNSAEIIIVHGGSGVGKSSLVLAGLVPQAEETGHWMVLSPRRAGESPMMVLPRWKQELEAGEAVDFGAAVKAYLESEPNRRVLGVIDQGEELIATAEGRVFWDELLEAKSATGERFCPVFVVHSQDLPEIEKLAKGLALHPMLVERMDADCLRDAIEGPAQDYVLYFEPPSVVDRLVDDVRSAPGAIALLSLALSEMYRSYVREQRNDRCIREAFYDDLGGIGGLVSRKLDDLYRDAVDDAERATLRRILARMLSFKDARMTSRQILLSELRWPEREEQVRIDEMVRRLRGARLVVVDVDESGHVYVQAAHDSVVTGASTVATLVRGEQDAIALQQWLGQEARKWNLPSISDRRLPELLALLERDPLRFSDVERRFLRATRQRRTTVRASVGLSVVVVIVGLVAGLIEITKQKDEARAKLYASYVDKGQALLAAGDPLRALAWLNHAYQSDSKDSRLGFLLARASATVDGLSLPLRITEETKLSMMTRQRNGRISVSSDGRWVAAIIDDNHVSVWEVETRQEFRFPHALPLVMQIRFDPQGQRLVVVTGGRGPETVHVWTFQSNTIVDLKGHEEAGSQIRVHDAVFRPDGERIATAGEDGTARIWNASTGREIVKLGPHGAGVNVVAFGSQDRLLVTGSKDHHARIWARTADDRYELVRELPDHGDEIVTTEFSADGEHIVTGSSNGRVFVWSADGKKEAELQTGFKIRSAAFSADARHVLTVDESNTAKVWDAETGAHLLRLEGHSERIFAGAYSPDGDHIATAGADATTRLWDAHNGQMEFVLPVGTWVDAVAFRADGSMAATVGLDGMMRTLQMGDRGLLDIIHAHVGEVSTIAVSAASRRFATGSNDGIVRLWDSESRVLLASLPGDAPVKAIAFDAKDEHRVFVATDQGDVFAWNVRDPLKPQIVQKTTTAPKSNGSSFVDELFADVSLAVAFSPDGSLVAIGWSGKIEVRETGNAANVRCSLPIESQAQGNRVGRLSVAFTADGQRIATMGVNMREPAFGALWDAKTCTFVMPLHVPEKTEIVRLGTDERMLLTSESALAGGEKDHTVHFWDAVTGTLRGAPGKHSESVQSAAFDPSGAQAATGSANQTGSANETRSANETVLWDIASWSALARWWTSSRVSALARKPTSSRISAPAARLPSSWVSALAFVPEKRKLLVGTADGFLHVRDLAPEPRNKAQIQALVRCLVPYKISKAAGGEGTDLLVDATPDPSACDSAKIQPFPNRPSVQAHVFTQRADRALVAGELVTATQFYEKARQTFHELGHAVGEAEVTLKLAAMGEKGVIDENRFREALVLLDATTPSAENRTKALLGVGDFFLNEALMPDAAARVLEAINERTRANMQTGDWRPADPWNTEDPNLLYLTALVGAGRFKEGLSYANNTQEKNEQFRGFSHGIPLAFMTLAWIAAVQMKDQTLASKWAQRINHEYNPSNDSSSGEARFLRATRSVLLHQNLVRHADVLQVLEWAAHPREDETAKRLAKLL